MIDPPWRRGGAPSARMRILGWYVLLLAAALGAALILQRTFLLNQASDEVDRALVREVGELRQLVELGIDPDTGEPFGGDLGAIFVTFLQRNAPLEGEAVVTILAGTPFRSDIGGEDYRDAEIMDTWVAIAETTRDEVDTEHGPIQYLAVPMFFDGAQAGVFVIAAEMDRHTARIDEVVRLGAVVYGSIFLIASAVAWVAAGGVLRPLRLLDDTARTITESDLSQRIPVEGDDEIAELAMTFNGMLDRLEEAFATQRRFVDDAGHELRTPITIIGGQLELLGDDPAERRETIALVTDELDRMSRIVEDLLALAKAEQPDFIDPHPLDLPELTHELSAKASALNGRSWPVERAETAVLVADRQRITQAVMNLARNAIEHTPPGTLVALGSEVRGTEARIWVRDNGPGITAADQERIFERFSRGATGRRTTSGAGLGLSIVRAIAEAHQGRVELDSGPDRGTTFTLVIPVEPPETDEEEA